MKQGVSSHDVRALAAKNNQQLEHHKQDVCGRKSGKLGADCDA